MTSLSEAYGGRGRSEVDPRRLSLGVGSFVAGTLLLVAGILVAAEVLLPGGYGSGAARRLGGVLGGVGVPLLLIGVMTVLPADRSTRATALIGAAVMCLGVALFAHAYPYQWVGGPRPELTDLTLPTAGLYFLGAATTLWSVFVGVANFKTRNDPGGTVTMEVTHKGETKIIEVGRDQLDGMGGVGLLGGTPDGEVETQTNRPNSSREGTSGSGSAGNGPRTERSPPTGGSQSAGGAGPGSVANGPGVGSAGVSDGGNTTADITSPLDAPGGSTSTGRAGRSSPSSRSDPSSSGPSPTDPTRPSAEASARDGPGDTYCGNCAQFDYVRTDDGMQPYCGHYDELMDDMDACEEWTPR
ncbi:DUF7139 domain-containing protein [Halorubrum trueperi]|uniref:Uncharacterized protein n=1 Tax=Halorubrum trueperi TaxID=2004704 RepID=A0ABD5UKR2_9EURY